MRTGKQRPSERGIRKFKGETVFDWDSEPSEMRPSEFVESTLASPMWTTPSRLEAAPLETRRAGPPRKQGGVGTVWLALAVAVALGSALLEAAVHWLSHR